jgi:hypothetical protein
MRCTVDVVISQSLFTDLGGMWSSLLVSSSYNTHANILKFPM